MMNNGYGEEANKEAGEQRAGGRQWMENEEVVNISLVNQTALHLSEPVVAQGSWVSLASAVITYSTGLFPTALTLSTNAAQR